MDRAIRQPLSALGCVSGRFQPFHDDHLSLVRHALGHVRHLIVAITNPDARSLTSIRQSAHRHLPSANPFTWFERLQMIVAALDAEGVARTRFSVVPMPLDAPDTWHAYVPAHAIQFVRVFSDWEREKVRRLEAGGYSTIALEGDPHRRIHAAHLRADMAARGRAWHRQVPVGTRKVLLGMDSDALARRCSIDAGCAQATPDVVEGGR